MKKKNETNDSSILNVHVSRHSTYSLEMESATGRDELKELCAHNTHTQYFLITQVVFSFSFFLPVCYMVEYLQVSSHIMFQLV